MKVRFAVQGKLPCTYFINSELRESLRGRKLQHLSLLTKLGKMRTSSLRRLLPKEFDPVLFEKLVNEGRVYIKYPRVNNNNKDAYKREVLDYVRTIDGFATDLWREDIDELWAKIVGAPCFESCLSMKNGIQAGHLNRYTVTNLVCRMQNMGVYRSDVPMLTLHLTLEQTDKRNKYYSSNGNYFLSKEAKALLRQLLLKV